jgi:hypothetical protein
LRHGPEASGQESWSVIRLPDLPQREENLQARHRLGADLASVLSLALGRRIIVPVDQDIQELDKVHFLPVAQIVDKGILGPLPADAKERIIRYFIAVAGLNAVDQEVIGAAASAYHGALLLFDREPRSAYTLLVAGIEVLSRKYGSPPIDWASWEESTEWDKFFIAHAMTQEQIDALRIRLMRDKQLRLGATFRNYGSNRVDDSFWNKILEQWIPGIDANTGPSLPRRMVKACRVSDLLSADRASLSKALSNSYQLRSSVVHESKWVELMPLAQFQKQPLQSHQALPFPLLRELLADLIWTEISSRTSPTELPKFQVLRTPTDSALDVPN